jgi:hypothetical protein
MIREPQGRGHTAVPKLHPVEAYTGIDNASMQGGLSRTGLIGEGALRDVSWTHGREWLSALDYGLWRRDFNERPQPASCAT